MLMPPRIGTDTRRPLFPSCLYSALGMSAAIAQCLYLWKPWGLMTVLTLLLKLRCLEKQDLVADFPNKCDAVAAVANVRLTAGKQKFEYDGRRAFIASQEHSWTMEFKPCS